MKWGNGQTTCVWAICIIIVSLVVRSTVLEISHGRAALPAAAAANVPAIPPIQPAIEARPNPVVAVVAKAVVTPTVLKIAPPPPAPPVVKPAVTPVAASLTPDQLFRSASPSVFVVEVTNDQKTWSALGSGFLVSSDGLLVTNFHVIRNGSKATIRTADGSEFAVLGAVAVDPDSDLAILKTTLTAKPFLNLGDDNSPPIGTRVYAIGNPMGLTNSLSEGLISGVRPSGAKFSMLQTTAAISHGSSGGPLMTSDAKVVGVTSAMLENAENLNLAVPVSRVRRLMSHRGPVAPLAIAAAVQGSGDDAETFSKMMSAIVLHDYRRAADALAAAPDKKSPRYWIMSGWFQETIGNAGMAAENFQHAIQLGQKDSRTYSLLGEALFAARQYDEAINALRSAVKLDPDNIPAWETAAVCFQAQDEDERAIDIVHKAMKIKSDDAGYYVILGYSYQRLKQTDAAISAYTKYVVLKPEDPVGWCGLGDLALVSGNFDQADGYFEKALTARPDWAYAYLELGQVRYRKGDLNGAVGDWETAIRFDPHGHVGRAASVCIRRASMASGN